MKTKLRVTPLSEQLKKGLSLLDSAACSSS